MKPIRVLLSLLMVMVMAILLVSPVSANAIGFDAESAYEAIFVVYSGNSLGSGFAVGENCIVTNAHVIADSDHVTIISYGGDELEAVILGISEDEDIAVLVVDNITFPYLPVADLASMKTGDDIYAIGAPKGMAYTLTKGSVSAKERIVRSKSYIQIDAAINEGNSGGPLLNDNGQVLGMNSLKMSDSEGIGLAIPISQICEYISSLGIELDEIGNISGNVDVPNSVSSPSESANHEENQIDSHDTKLASPITAVAVIVALLSLIGNIVLSIMLIYQKKKNIDIQYDPSERTDFDIDVWE